MEESKQILSYASPAEPLAALDRSEFPWQLHLDPPAVFLRMIFLAVAFVICSIYLAVFTFIVVFGVSVGGSIHLTWQVALVLLLGWLWRTIAISLANLFRFRSSSITVGVGSGSLGIHHAAKFAPPTRRWDHDHVVSVRVRRSLMHFITGTYTLELITAGDVVWDIDFHDRSPAASERVEDGIIGALNAQARALSNG